MDLHISRKILDVTSCDPMWYVKKQWNLGLNDNWNESFGFDFLAKWAQFNHKGQFMCEMYKPSRTVQPLSHIHNVTACLPAWNECESKQERYSTLLRVSQDRQSNCKKKKKKEAEVVGLLVTTRTQAKHCNISPTKGMNMYYSRTCKFICMCQLKF